MKPGLEWTADYWNPQPPPEETLEQFRHAIANMLSRLRG